MLSDDTMIPLGLCQCGCGQPTRPSPRTSRRDGIVKGVPVRYLPNHHKMKPWYRVDSETGCWEGLYRKNARGYTMVGNTHMHRVLYEQHRGPIPKGMHLDHLCRNRGCVNPWHTEPVTNAENSRRGAATPLTAQDVAEIRSLAETVPRRELAARFGVSRPTIHRIIHRQRWDN